VAEVSYRITAKDESRAALDSASKHVTDLQQKTEKATAGLHAGWLKATVAITGAVVAFKAISRTFDELAKKWAVQEQAVAGLDAAIKSVGNEGVVSSAKVQALAKSLQAVTTYGDEATISAAGILEQLSGLNQKGLEKTIPLVQDMAAAMHLDLFTAASLVGKTLGSTTNALSRYGVVLDATAPPAEKLAQLTQVMTEKFGGMAQALGSTTTGKITQVKNAFGDLQEQLGRVVTSIQAAGSEGMLKVLNGVTKWLEDNGDKIINFFIHFPEIAQVAFSHLFDIVKGYFTGDFWINFFTITWQNFKDIGVAAFHWEINYLNAIKEVFWEPLKVGFEWIIYGIRIAFVAAVNALIGILNNLLTPINATISVINKISGKNVGPVGIGKLTGANIPKPEKVDIGAMLGAAGQAAGSLGDLIKTIAVSSAREAGAVLKPFGDFAKNIAPEIQKILEKELPAWMKSGVEKGATAAGAAAGAVAAGGLPSGKTGGLGAVPFASGAASPISGFAQAMMSVVQVVSPLIGMFGGLIGSLASVQAVLNPLTVIFNAALSVLQPVIDGVLAPLIGIFVILGRALGAVLVPIVQALSPVIMFLTEAFIWLYNHALVPVANAFIFVGNLIKTAIAAVMNGIIALINGALGWLGVHLGYVKAPASLTSGFLQTINANDVTAAGAQYNSASGGAGGTAAQYSSGPSVNVSVVINTNVILGTKQDFAVWIAQEIKNAVQLGLA